MDKLSELCNYRLEQSAETLKASETCFDAGFYKDAINRSYYSVFYALKAVLALEGVDFKRHKDVVAYFNLHYVKEGEFEREIGKRVGRLQQIREKSDYDDFFIASKAQAEEQIQSAYLIHEAVMNHVQHIKQGDCDE